MNYLRENNAQLELRVRELLKQINELKAAAVQTSAVNAALQKRIDDLNAAQDKDVLMSPKEYGAFKKRS